MKINFTQTALCILLISCSLFIVPRSSFAQCGSLAATVSTTESRCVATGSITINASGGMAPEVYQYLISDGPITTTYSSVNTFNGLPPGTYTVVINDVTAGCTITKNNIVITGSYVAPGIFYTSTEPTCMNGTDGTISVTSQVGGRAPFNYEIIAPSPFDVGTVSANGTFTNLTPGLYYIQMTDSCGGVQTRTQLVNGYSWSILNSSNVTNNCHNITANIYLTNSNGVNSPNAAYAGFQYGISRFTGDTTWFSSSTFGFDMGMYRNATIVVEDNCGNVQSFNWTEPKASVSATVSTSNKTCTSFTATVTGQQNINPSFTQYCLYDSTNTVLIGSCQSSPEFDNLPYGTYNIQITDSCYDTTILRTVTATVPVPSIDDNPLVVYSCISFSATITGQKDTSNAMYCLYTNGNPIPDTCNTTGIFDSLTYGNNYCVQMHSSSACFDTVITRCFTVDKNVPAVNASINTSNKTCTSFTATVTGQTNLTNPTYQLYNSTNDSLIDSTQTSPVFNLLPYGSYCIHIINDSSCYDTTIIKCFTQAAPNINISLSAKGSCSVAGATNVKVSFQSGVAPFISTLYAPDGTVLFTAVSNGSSYTFNNLPGLTPGNLYKVIATDSCGGADTVTIASAIYTFNRNITVTPMCPTGTSPNGSSDVKIVVTENRGGNFSTVIIKQDGSNVNINSTSTINSGNTHTFSFSSLSPATYIFDTYSQSCGTHWYDTVTVTNYIYPSLTNSKGYLCDNSAQTVSSVTTGGLPPYQYQIFGSVPAVPSITTPYQSSPDFAINNGIQYSLIRLRVLDGCANASINDVGFISVATPAIHASNTCILSSAFLWVDSVDNAIRVWYKRTYNPIDSVFLDSGNVYNFPSLSLSDSGTYISKTIINSGCEVRVSYFALNPGSGCLLVPAKLESFTGVNQNNHSLLNWTITAELNATSFTIERSTDNGKTWIPIGNVAASNNLKKSYSFTDSNPGDGTNLYRLKVVDNNKNITYSSIIQIKMQSTNSVAVYPNPLGKNDVATIQLTGFKAGAYTISMVSSPGQTIKEMGFTIANTGNISLTMPLINLASGSYQVIVKGSYGQYSKPIFITNQ